LDALVQLFWEQGYEATSMADIVAATGLNKSSLYSSFGSENQLFEMALDRYVDFRAGMMNQLVGNGTQGLDDVTMFLEYLWTEVNDMDEHRCCLAVNTSTEMGTRDQGVADIGSRYRSLMRDGLSKAFTRAANRGEIDAANVETYTSLMVSFMIGTAVMVRSGAPDEELRGQIDAAVKTVDSWRLSQTKQTFSMAVSQNDCRYSPSNCSH
jgi:TetR/AcrR family transcriptional repressor of nem operon